MGVDQIIRIDRLASNLGVEIEAARRKTATFKQLVKHQGQLGHVHRELIGIPAQ